MKPCTRDQTLLAVMVASLVTALVLFMVVMTSVANVVLVHAAGGGLFDQDPNVIDIDTEQLDKVAPARANECPWLVLFYNSYCGHCRNFAPSLTKFAAGLDAQSPVLIAALNCVTHGDACTRMSIRGVPAMFTRSVGASAKYAPIGDIHQLGPVAATATTDAHLSPEKVAACVALKEELLSVKPGNAGRKKVVFAPVVTTNAAVLAVTTPDATVAAAGKTGVTIKHDEAQHQLHQADVAAALFLALRDEVPLAVTSPSRDALPALRRFLSVVGAVFGTKLGDMGGLAKALPPAAAGQLRALSPVQWKDAVFAARIPFEGSRQDPEWRMCKGSKPNTRGLPCGLWSLYHALLANSARGTAAETLVAIRGFVEHFFSCQECRQHFLQVEFKLDAGASDVEATVWLWRAHNAANARLTVGQEGAAGDPAAPKVLWPTPLMCPTCAKQGAATNDLGALKSLDDFDEKRVVQFLEQHYRWDRLVKSRAAVVSEQRRQRREQAAGGRQQVGTDPAARVAMSEQHSATGAVGLILAFFAVSLTAIVVLRRRRTGGPARTPTNGRNVSPHHVIGRSRAM